ncbi:response regulator [Luteitalea sp. TBR-22]|uniref:response regulator n=1 Tax=Luteitalea sp. TBR-22 TaxID=2802971 RepID=UPI00351D2B5B
MQVLRDGAEALDYLHRRGPFADRPHGEPCVILLDLKMPKVDGFEVLREVRSVDRLRHIPIVVTTSSREPGDVSRCHQLGANAYVVKPLAYYQFIRTFRTTVAFWTECNLSWLEGAP